MKCMQTHICIMLSCIRTHFLKEQLCVLVVICITCPCNDVAQLDTSQLATVDMTMTFFSHSDVLGPSRITRKELASSIVHSALERTLCRFPLLHGGGACYPGLVVLSGDGNRSRSRVAETSARGAQWTDGRSSLTVLRMLR